MSRPSRWNWLLVLPLLVSLVVSFDVLSTMAARLTYPYDLEWMEGGVLAHAWRALHGKSIYPDPGPDFLPMVYTPGYYWLVAAFGKVFGIGYTLGRGVSIAGTLSACAAILWGTHRWTGRAPLGLVGVAIFLGAYESSGAFYDLVRPDALAMGLLAWTLVMAPDERASRQVGAAVLLFLAFTVKHNTAAFGVPLALGLWAMHGWRSALRFAVIAAVPALLFVGAMQLSTGGNFLTYIVGVPASHPIMWDRALPGSVRELGHALPATCAVLSLWFLAVGPRAVPNAPAPLLVVVPMVGAGATIWALLGMPEVPGLMPFPAAESVTAYALVGVVATAVPLTLAAMLLTRRVDGPWIYGFGVVAMSMVTAFIMRAHHGGFINVFIPMHFVLACATVLAVADALESLPGRAAPLAALLALAQPIQAWSSFELDRLVPTAADKAAGDSMVAYLKTIDGPILSPYAPWLPVQAGHDPHFHLISLWDIDHKDGPFVESGRLINQSIAKGRWAAIVDAERGMGHGVKYAYHVDKRFNFGGNGVFMAKTGWRQRPSVVWLPGRDTTPSGAVRANRTEDDPDPQNEQDNPPEPQP